MSHLSPNPEEFLYGSFISYLSGVGVDNPTLRGFPYPIPKGVRDSLPTHCPVLFTGIRQTNILSRSVVQGFQPTVSILLQLGLGFCVFSWVIMGCANKSCFVVLLSNTQNNNTLPHATYLEEWSKAFFDLESTILCPLLSPCLIHLLLLVKSILNSRNVISTFGILKYQSNRIIHDIAFHCKREKSQIPDHRHLKYFYAFQNRHSINPFAKSPIVPEFPQKTTRQS